MHTKYKVVQSGGKTYDLDTIVNEQPTSPRHRRLVGKAKAAKLVLRHDGMFMKAALRWYQCRVKYSGIDKFCDAEAERGILLDPKNVDKEIRPCDEAVGYLRRKGSEAHD